jgi:hypothetical protein
MKFKSTRVVGKVFEALCKFPDEQLIFKKEQKTCLWFNETNPPR